MKLPLLLLAFIPLTIAASNKNNKDIKLFCSEACPYLKNMDKNAKISFKRLDEKCKAKPKIPKFMCETKPDQKTAKFLEKHTWVEICKAVCK